jgi:NAD(P)H-dependent FMN reductase
VEDDMRRLNIPVVLGTTRRGRHSAHVASLMARLLGRREGVETGVIDLADVPLPLDDAGEAIKDPRFAAAMAAADGLVLVVPEYNHSFPGVLKHALDSCLNEYVHKAVGIVGVSSGPFGGTRVIQGLLPVMREIGLVTIFWDVNVGGVEQVFDADGRLLDEALVRRSERFLRELLWMSKVLREGRERVTIDEEAAERRADAQGGGPAGLECLECGVSMNHHADKPMAVEAMDPPAAVSAIHTCAACGALGIAGVSQLVAV